jgi:hypothetical protein
MYELAARKAAQRALGNTAARTAGVSTVTRHRRGNNGSPVAVILAVKSRLPDENVTAMRWCISPAPVSRPQYRRNQ